ncbi:hypothetical protein N0V90_001426 [Kalmusia sp. IMI 367209]|nr:hypothetical protein N0V90_001426 [Kalmusia sp. IMI 367209]
MSYDVSLELSTICLICASEHEVVIEIEIETKTEVIEPAESTIFDNGVACLKRPQPLDMVWLDSASGEEGGLEEA